LYYEETLTAGNRLHSLADDSLSFETASNLGGFGIASASVRGESDPNHLNSFRTTTSVISSTSTFRDTYVDEMDANKLLHMQSLSSIVNNPKKETFIKKVKNFAKHQMQGNGAAYFKTMKEANVEDSTSIPRV